LTPARFAGGWAGIATAASENSTTAASERRTMREPSGSGGVGEVGGNCNEVVAQASSLVPASHEGTSEDACATTVPRSLSYPHTSTPAPTGGNRWRRIPACACSGRR